MQSLTNSALLADILGGWETLLILTVVLILYGSKRLPKLRSGFRRGIREFSKATEEITEELDDNAHDAGKSIAGIHGRPAYQALTPDNQTAELYNPALRKKHPAAPKKPIGVDWRRICSQLRRIWGFLFRLLGGQSSA